MPTVHITFTPLACTACIETQFLYHYPYMGLGLLVALVWFGAEAWGTTTGTSKSRQIAMFCGIVIGTIWFTFCMIPWAWGGLTGVVAGLATLIVACNPHTNRERRRLAVACLTMLGLLVATSIGTYCRIDHHIAWLGRLPTHGTENSRPVDFIRSSKDSVEAKLVNAAQQGIASSNFPEWNRLAAISREICRLNSSATTPVMSLIRDRALRELSENEYPPRGLTTVILACGQASNCHLTDDFGQRAEQCLEQKNDDGAIILMTAWGLADRDSALNWIKHHDTSRLDSITKQEDHNLRVVQAIWKAIQSGPLDANDVQQQLDSLSPATLSIN